jgi:hypothetical protein
MGRRWKLKDLKANFGIGIAVAGRITVSITTIMAAATAAVVVGVVTVWITVVILTIMVVTVCIIVISLLLLLFAAHGGEQHRDVEQCFEPHERPSVQWYDTTRSHLRPVPAYAEFHVAIPA